MPGIKTTIIDKDSGAIETLGGEAMSLPKPIDEIPTLTEWWACYRNNKIVNKFITEEHAKNYCNRGFADSYKKEFN
jgi:hypothetical protein